MTTVKNGLQIKQAIPYAIKSVGAKVQDVDLTKRIVTGFYNSFNFFDSDKDVLRIGSTAKSIADRGPASNATARIKHLLHHDWKLLPGKVKLLEERKVGGITGVYFETKMSETQDGTDTLINYQEEIYDNHSIGFCYVSGIWVEKGSKDWDIHIQTLLNPEEAEKSDEMYLWDEIKMFEGSTVAFGANSLTPYLGVKSQNKASLAIKIQDRITNLGRQLKGGTQSDDMMQSFEMELLQLKQCIQEIFTVEPSIKDTLKQKGRADQDTNGNKSAIDFKLFSNALTTN